MMASNAPLASVIIPTYNREQQLVDTIEYVLGNTYPAFELIVVDQTEEHKEEVAEKLNALQSDDRFQYVQLPIANLPLARNVGLHVSQGEIIVFIDDDVELDTDFIAAHVTQYESDDVAAVGGRIIDRGTRVEDKSGDSTPGQLEPDGTRTPYFWKEQPATIGWGMGCNMSFRRSVLDEIGGFDERYTGIAKNEEIDVFSRLQQAEYRVTFAPDARVIHLNAASGGCRSREEALKRAGNVLRCEALFMMQHVGQHSIHGFFHVVKNGLHQAKHTASSLPSTSAYHYLKNLSQLWIAYLLGIHSHFFDGADRLSRQVDLPSSTKSGTGPQSFTA